MNTNGCKTSRVVRGEPRTAWAPTPTTSYRIQRAEMGIFPIIRPNNDAADHFNFRLKIRRESARALNGKRG